MNTPIRAQLKQNAVAIISLIIAIIALTYTAWREEVTEKNRNTRTAAFEVLKNLGQLQVVIDYARFGSNEIAMGNPILGWGYIALIGDLGEVLPEPIPERTQALIKTWRENWEQIEHSDEAVEKITHEVDSSRDAVLGIIKKLK